MTRAKRAVSRAITGILGALLIYGTQAMAEPKHGIAMYGEPALGPDFKALPYANPDAPQGGRIVFGERGGFDSLNPYILKGRAPWGVRAHTVESLLGRSYDEPFTLYGLLAETVETGPNREWVEFTLRKEAKFSDGSPVTAEDVIWSFETLGTKGHPRYQSTWAKIDKAEKTGERSVRFTFNVTDFEAPLILGLRPILQKQNFEGRDFAESGLFTVVGSGPYVLDDFEPGRFASFKKNPDYWGKDVPFNRGRNNADELRYEYFEDQNVIFEAFKAGEISWYRESNAGRWATNYDFPRMASGDVVKTEIPHQRPSGMIGFVMNSRRDKFKDWRVRDALIHAFNFEFINKSLNGGVDPRIQSYFSNSVLGMDVGKPASGKVAEILNQYKDHLLPGALEGYALPVSDGSAQNRSNLRKARKLLQEAGWTVQEGVLKNAAGEPFTFDILLKTGSTRNEGIVNVWSDALKRLGISTTMSQVDNAQYTERKNSYDYDVVYNYYFLSLSPGNEQKLYWGRNGVTEPGTRNYMGVDNPAIEGIVDAMLTAPSQEDFVAATKALDRVLTTGRYVVPIWYSAVSRLAHSKEMQHPERLPAYGDWSGFLPDVWWVAE